MQKLQWPREQGWIVQWHQNFIRLWTWHFWCFWANRHYLGKQTLHQNSKTWKINDRYWYYSPLVALFILLYIYFICYFNSSCWTISNHLMWWEFLWSFWRRNINQTSYWGAKNERCRQRKQLSNLYIHSMLLQTVQTKYHLIRRFLQWLLKICLDCLITRCWCLNLYRCCEHNFENFFDQFS